MRARARGGRGGAGGGAGAGGLAPPAARRPRGGPATAEEGAKKINDDVEEMLQQMKRDLGIK